MEPEIKSATKQKTDPKTFQVTVSLFNNKHDIVPRSCTTNLGDLLSNRRISSNKDQDAFSGFSYLPGTTRGAAGLDTTVLLCLDIEKKLDGEKSSGVEQEIVDAIKQKAAGLAWVMYSSFSDRLDSDLRRVRFLFMLDRSINRSEYEIVSRVWFMEIAKALNLSRLKDFMDETSMSPAQIFYLPSSPLDRADKAEIEFHSGGLLSVDIAFEIAKRKNVTSSSRGNFSQSTSAEIRKLASFKDLDLVSAHCAAFEKIWCMYQNLSLPDNETRVRLAQFCIGLGFSDAMILELFKKNENFSESKTRYHISKLRENYKRPGCNSLGQFTGACSGNCPSQSRIGCRSPLGLFKITKTEKVILK